MYCEKCGMHMQDGTQKCLCCGSSLTTVSEDAQIPDLPMKWYHFQIWFRLWVSAAWNALSGVLVLTNALSNDGLYTSYTASNQLGALELFEIVLYFAFAVLCVITRFQLSGYKKNAVTWVCWTELTPFITTVFISLMTGITTGASGIDILLSSTTAAPALVLFFANRKYFNRRAHLFNN